MASGKVIKYRLLLVIFARSIKFRKGEVMDNLSIAALAGIFALGSVAGGALVAFAAMHIISIWREQNEDYRGALEDLAGHYVSGAIPGVRMHAHVLRAIEILGKWQPNQKEESEL